MELSSVVINVDLDESRFSAADERSHCHPELRSLRSALFSCCEQRGFLIVRRACFARGDEILQAQAARTNRRIGRGAKSGFPHAPIPQSGTTLSSVLTHNSN